MPGTRRTNLDAYRQLAAVEKHDNPQHFAQALGALRKPKAVTNPGRAEAMTSVPA